MTEAETREYLIRYRTEKRKIRRLTEQIAELRESQISARGVNIDAMPHGGGGSDLSNYAARLDELEHKLLEQKKVAGEFLLEEIRAINSIEDERVRTVLTLYYVRGYRWEEICTIHGYSWRQTFRLRNRGIKALMEVLDEGRETET